MKTVHDIIIRPVITEDSMARCADKKYTFEVMAGATKSEIAAAVEELFKVSVLCVNTISMKKKPKRLGYHPVSYTHLYTERDADGYPHLALENDHFYAVADKLCSLFGNAGDYIEANKDVYKRQGKYYVIL